MTPIRPRVGIHSAFALALLVFTAALAVRLLGVAEARLHIDELYTVLAARSLAEEGVPRIWHGEYTRAYGFTAIVAGALGAFGDHLVAARLPSVIAGALWVTLVFVWLRREAGLKAAVIVALLLGLSASAIAISQFARFYALHALAFWVAAIATYWSVASVARLSHALGFGAVAVVAAALAWHLQTITVFGVAALAVWAAAALLVAAPASQRRELWLQGRWLLAAAAAAALVLALWLAWRGVPDAIGNAWAQYRWSTLWALEHRDDAGFYLRQLARAWPLLFYLWPVAAVIAFARAPRPTAFCITVSAVALLLHSFAGMKDVRYVQYLWPFLLVPVAIAGASLLMVLMQSVGRIVQAASLSLPARYRGGAARALTGLSVAVLAGIVLVGNRDYSSLRTLPLTAAAHLGVGPYAARSRAEAAARREAALVFERLANETGLLLTSSELHALWHIGRYDVLVHAGRLHELGVRHEFARDPRTGGVVISNADSLHRVLDCGAPGTLLVWRGDWRRPEAITDAMADAIEATMHESALPAAIGVRAFQWEARGARNERCPFSPHDVSPGRLARWQKP